MNLVSRLCLYDMMLVTAGKQIYFDLLDNLRESELLSSIEYHLDVHSS